MMMAIPAGEKWYLVSLTNDSRCWTSFHVLFGHLDILLGEMSVRIPYPFLNWVVCLFMVDWLGCFIFLDTRPTSEERGWNASQGALSFLEHWGFLELLLLVLGSVFEVSQRDFSVPWEGGHLPHESPFTSSSLESTALTHFRRHMVNSSQGLWCPTQQGPGPAAGFHIKEKGKCRSFQG